jgi:hypothetical protein
VSGDHLVFGIDQHRHVKTKGLDAARDLADLPGAVKPGVSRVKL